MDTINAVKDSFKKAEEIIEDDATDITLFLLWKKNSKSDMQFSKAEIGNEEKESFIKRFKEDYSSSDEYSPYSVIMEKTDRKIYINKDFFPLMNSYISALNLDVPDSDKKYNGDLDGVVDHLDYVKGYCADFVNTDTKKHVYLFGGVAGFNSMQKKKALGMIGNVTVSGITKLSDNNKILGFRPHTICYIYEDTCVIQSKQGFENLFGLIEEYKKSALEVVKTMEEDSDFFQGFSQMKNDLEKKPIYYRSLVKFSKYPERLQKLSDHLSDIEDVVKENGNFSNDYDKVVLNDKGIVYSTDALEQILSLLNEKPVSSLITGEEFLADRDE
ncbi:Kiwa anti-phage protein KwaB-like domain-containing protein [Limosilactobacillus reuteri]|uniref:DUF4868 domain-containing protein n=1 Tax=Limosilactobacillus reuteri subsp. rodentium (strain DSM 17509 / CIP 109821 / 100-23) TaxID=349123 RepID=B3XM85_LIMR1|nr:Kiwa anti-phage protein KwaB-like domain-containing protein [Limosilactobacillus reuteri]EDX42489.1 hypothetical protein Lreu23DRAFT_4005 [Limosilactobacillus reuteri subsp. rodentium]MCC4476512.1 DUF4868 domain-containing protein [Limosilactobacillus reuteri]